MKRLTIMTLGLALIVTACLTVGTAQAQTIKEPQWVASVEQEVRNIYATQLNIPLIETKMGKLFALEPGSGEILWKISMPRTIGSVTPIDGTPYSFIDGLLVNINNGKSVDLGQLIKGNIQDWYIIPESYDLFIHSTAPEYFTVIDLFTSEVRWTMKSDIAGKSAQEGKGKLGAALMQASSPNLEVGLECAPISNKNVGVIIAGYGKVTSIDAKGQIVWSTNQPKKKKGGLVQQVDNKTELLLDDTRDQFYIMKSKVMMAMKLSDGTEMWPDFYTVKGDVMLNTPAGILPLTMYQDGTNGSGSTGLLTKAKLNMVDAATGKAMWPSDLELKATIDHYRVLPDGRVALITYNQTNSRFQILDPKTGKFAFPEEVKLKGRVENFIVGTGKAMFSTTRGIDLLDLNTGGDLLNKMPKFDDDADVATICNKQFIYSIDTKNRDVYKTDLLTNESKKVLGSYKFDVNEPLAKYDVLDDGRLFLASEHHMKVYSTTGDELLSKAFDYQGKGWDKFHKATSGVSSAYHSVVRSAAFTLSAMVALGDAAGSGGPTPEGQALANSIKAPELARHNLAKNAKAAEYYISLKRLRPDGASAGSFFVRRDKGAKQSYISYVSKSTGDVIYDIPLEEDAVAPEFAIGEDVGFLYYAPNFVNQDKAEWQVIFNPAKLRQAEANNRSGFVAGYQF